MIEVTSETSMKHLHGMRLLSLRAATAAACAGNIDGNDQADNPAMTGNGPGGPAGMGGQGGTGNIPINGPVTSSPSPSVRFARLSHRQYDNTVRDLLRLPATTP